MNRTHGTPLHRKHSNILCNCSACKQFDYAATAPLPRRIPTKRNDSIVAFERIKYRNAETGARGVFYCPIYRQDKQPHITQTAYVHSHGKA